MTNIDKIKKMDEDELAEMLIYEGETEEIDYDWDDSPYTYTVSCWYTPIGEFPHWFSREDVKEEILEWLRKDIDDEKGSVLL